MTSRIGNRSESFTGPPQSLATDARMDITGSNFLLWFGLWGVVVSVLVCVAAFSHEEER